MLMLWMLVLWSNPVVFAEISDASWEKIIAICYGLFIAWQVHQSKRDLTKKLDETKAEVAAKVDTTKEAIEDNTRITVKVAGMQATKAKEVKDALIATNEVKDAKLDLIYNMVNGPMLVQLKRVAELARKIANLAPTPEHEAEALAAERACIASTATKQIATEKKETL